jgi:hypothetical protein
MIVDHDITPGCVTNSFVVGFPAEWLNADLHATRLPRTARTIAISKHAPMKPAIR